MYTLNKFAFVAISALGLVGTAAAAPVDNLPADADPDVQAAARHGWATHYNPGLGACGFTNTGSEHVVAIGHALYDKMLPPGDQNPNDSKACGKHVHVSWQGKSTNAKVVDRCVACGENDLDLSPAAFKDLAPLGTGRLSGITWKFV